MKVAESLRIPCIEMPPPGRFRNRCTGKRHKDCAGDLARRYRAGRAGAVPFWQCRTGSCIPLQTEGARFPLSVRSLPYLQMSWTSTGRSEERELTSPPVPRLVIPSRRKREPFSKTIPSATRQQNTPSCTLRNSSVPGMLLRQQLRVPLVRAPVRR